MTFSAQIRQAVEPIWAASMEHPFVKGIGDGTLPLENFRFYIQQDSYYLTRFAKILALGAAKAPDIATTNQFADFAKHTYSAEIGLHEQFSKRLGITAEEKELFKPAPTTYAYTSHLYRAGHAGHLGDVIAAVLPCYWIYAEIGDAFIDAAPEEPIYQEWIATYGGKDFQDRVDEQIEHLDKIAAAVSEADRERMKEHFIISSQYEYAFWEMAYRMETWPVPLEN